MYTSVTPLIKSPRSDGIVKFECSEAGEVVKIHLIARATAKRVQNQAKPAEMKNSNRT